MKLAITGVCGDIGGAFTRHAAKTYQINALIREGVSLRLKNTHEKIARYPYDKSNVYESAFVKSFTRADAVIHFAALLAGNDHSILDYLTTNAMLTGMLVQFSAKQKLPYATHFIYISSEMVYRLPDKKLIKKLADSFTLFCKSNFAAKNVVTSDLQLLTKKFMDENSYFPFEKYNPYALSKYLGEQVVLSHPQSTVLRITNAYGPGYDKLRLIPKLIINRLTGHTTTYTKQQRDFVYNADIHALIDKILQVTITGIIDCKSAEIIDTDELRKMIIRLTPTAYGTLKKTPGEKKNQNLYPIPAASKSLPTILAEVTPFKTGLIKTLRYHKEMCYHQMGDLRNISDFILPGETLIGKLHGSSAAYLFVVDSEDGKKVRKIAIRDGVEGNGVAKVKNEIHYYQYISQKYKKLAKLYPKLIDSQTDGNFSTETLEYLNGHNFYEELQIGTFSESIYEKSVEQFIDKLVKSTHDTFRQSTNDENALDVYYLERALDRLQPIKNLIKVKDTIVINGKELLAPHSILTDLLENKKLRPFITPQVKGFCFHGDMTLLNTVFIKDTKEIRLIDPRGYTGEWDPLYDFAKFKLSLDGFGEFIFGKKPIIKKQTDGFSINFSQIPKNASYLNDKFFSILENNAKFAEKIITREPYWKDRIKLGAATHFLADIPFRLYTDSGKWTALASYLLGTYYLNAEYASLKNR